MIISSWHQLPASALLLTSCLLCCGEGNENKRLLWKKSLATGQSVYSLDSKRLSHEGLISAASQFCRKKASNVMRRQDRKTNTKMGLFHCLFMLVGMISLGFCLTEMGFSQSLAFFDAFRLLLLNSCSWPLAASVWDGNPSEGRCCDPRQGFVSRLDGWPSSFQRGSLLHVWRAQFKLWTPFS